jgi:hypothetical protein
MGCANSIGVLRARRVRKSGQLRRFPISLICSEIEFANPTGSILAKLDGGSILAKLELRDRAQAVVVPYKTGLVSPGENDTRTSLKRVEFTKSTQDRLQLALLHGVHLPAISRRAHARSHTRRWTWLATGLVHTEMPCRGGWAAVAVAPTRRHLGLWASTGSQSSSVTARNACARISTTGRVSS